MNDIPDPNLNRLPIPRQSLPMMAEAYRIAIEEMKAALVSLDGAQKRLRLAFGDGSAMRSCFDFEEVWRRAYDELPPPEALELHWRQAAWRILIDRMELKRICSVARAEAIDTQLNDPKQLPEITEATMVAMIEGNVRNVSEFLVEAVKECFDQLRPYHRGDSGDGMKTNCVYRVGERVVIHYAVSQVYGNGKFRVSYHGSKTQLLRCLDNVMHLLDGKGTVPTHAGPLVDALNSPENQGFIETEYFEAKSFKNQNLHLRFKRLDLLDRLNAMGADGSMTLPGGRK